MDAGEISISAAAEIASLRPKDQKSFLQGHNEAKLTAQRVRKFQKLERIAKEQEGRRLLKLDEVVAVGIGAGDDPDHAALAVYVKNDPSEVSAKIPSKIGGVPVKVKQAGAFRSAVDCGASPFAPALTH